MNTCPICNGEQFEDLIDTPEVEELCLLHFLMLLDGEIELVNWLIKKGTKPLPTIKKLLRTKT